MKIITLTDHRTHGPYESIYRLLRSVTENDDCEELWVASRSLNENAAFFTVSELSHLTARRVDQEFRFDHDGRWFMNHGERHDVRDFDAIFLRVDRPVSDAFLDSLRLRFPDQRIINDPIGIQETGAKDFLLRFPELCPPLRVCTSLDEIREEASRYPIVAKPLRSYGGKGIVRIDKDVGWIGGEKTNSEAVYQNLEERLAKEDAVLVVKYLRGIDRGDKRVVVVNGEVLGATLRVPAPGSWIANVSQGAKACFADVDEQEHLIARTISPELTSRGVIVYGFDTLVGDDGKRVLSEINTLNVGGFIQAEEASGKPIVERAARLILDSLKR